MNSNRNSSSGISSNFTNLNVSNDRNQNPQIQSRMGLRPGNTGLNQLLGCQSNNCMFGGNSNTGHANTGVMNLSFGNQQNVNFHRNQFQNPGFYQAGNPCSSTPSQNHNVQAFTCIPRFRPLNQNMNIAQPCNSVTCIPNEQRFIADCGPKLWSQFANFAKNQMQGLNTGQRNYGLNYSPKNIDMQYHIPIQQGLNCGNNNIRHQNTNIHHHQACNLTKGSLGPILRPSNFLAQQGSNSPYGFPPLLQKFRNSGNNVIPIPAKGQKEPLFKPGKQDFNINGKQPETEGRISVDPSLETDLVLSNQSKTSLQTTGLIFADSKKPQTTVSAGDHSQTISSVFQSVQQPQTTSVVFPGLNPTSACTPQSGNQLQVPGLLSDGNHFQTSVCVIPGGNQLQSSGGFLSDGNQSHTSVCAVQSGNQSQATGLFLSDGSQSLSSACVIPSGNQSQATGLVLPSGNESKTTVTVHQAGNHSQSSTSLNGDKSQLSLCVASGGNLSVPSGFVSSAENQCHKSGFVETGNKSQFDCIHQVAVSTMTSQNVSRTNQQTVSYNGNQSAQLQTWPSINQFESKNCQNSSIIPELNQLNISENIHVCIVEEHKSMKRKIGEIDSDGPKQIDTVYNEDEIPVLTVEKDKPYKAIATEKVKYPFKVTQPDNSSLVSLQGEKTLEVPSKSKPEIKKDNQVVPTNQIQPKPSTSLNNIKLSYGHFDDDELNSTTESRKSFEHSATMATTVAESTKLCKYNSEISNAHGKDKFAKPENVNEIPNKTYEIAKNIEALIRMLTLRNKKLNAEHRTKVSEQKVNGIEYKREQLDTVKQSGENVVYNFKKPTEMMLVCENLESRLPTRHTFQNTKSESMQEQSIEKIAENTKSDSGDGQLMTVDTSKNKFDTETPSINAPVSKELKSSESMEQKTYDTCTLKLPPDNFSAIIWDSIPPSNKSDINPSKKHLIKPAQQKPTACKNQDIEFVCVSSDGHWERVGDETVYYNEHISCESKKKKPITFPKHDGGTLIEISFGLNEKLNQVVTKVVAESVPKFDKEYFISKVQKKYPNKEKITNSDTSPACSVDTNMNKKETKKRQNITESETVVPKGSVKQEKTAEPGADSKGFGEKYGDIGYSTNNEVTKNNYKMVESVSTFTLSVGNHGDVGKGSPNQVSAADNQKFERVPSSDSKISDKNPVISSDTDSDSEGKIKSHSKDDAINSFCKVLTQEDCIIENVENVAVGDENSNNMYPRYNYGNSSQRGGRNQNFYNQRNTPGPQYSFQGHQNCAVRGNYNVQREIGGYSNSYVGRRENQFTQFSNNNEYGNSHGDYRNVGNEKHFSFQDNIREITGQRSIHDNRYNEGHNSGQRSRIQYPSDINTHVRKRSYNTDGEHSRSREEFQKSKSFDCYPSQSGLRKSDSFEKHPCDHCDVPNTAQPNKASPFKDKQEETFEKHSKKDISKAENLKNDNLNEDFKQSESKILESTSPSSHKLAASGKIYQSEQYFSATGKPESNKNSVRSPCRGRLDISDDKKDSRSPYRNLKRHASDIADKSPKSRESSSVSRQESNAVPVQAISSSNDQLLAKGKDKMDFSSIRKALNEVKNVQDDSVKQNIDDEIPANPLISHKNSSDKIQGTNDIEQETDNNPVLRRTNSCIENSVNTPIQISINKKMSTEDSPNNCTGQSPLQHNQRKSSLDKIHCSPRSRNSSGDNQTTCIMSPKQGLVSPKSYPELKQRSAFHSLQSHVHEDQPSDANKSSPNEATLSPLNRKRHVSQDSKNSVAISQKEADSAWLQTVPMIESSSSNVQDNPEADINLKSATTYIEWKRMKALQAAALQKEQERPRACIEQANTPEEYRRLLKLAKAKEKATASQSVSETEMETMNSDNSDGEKDTGHVQSLHNTQNSFRTIQDMEEPGLSDDDIDLEDSDDDDLEAPSFLFSLEEASNRPIPGTPTKLSSNFESPGPCSPAPEISDLTDITTKSLLSTKFSLDQLVSEKYDKSKDQREYEEMHAKLEEGLKKGGFIKDTLEEPVETNGELLPEQQNVVKKFQIFDSMISDVHPGDVIFQPLLYQRRFTGSLTLQTCGFTPGASYIDKYLSTLQPKDYSLLLTSNILKNTLETVSCLESVLRWLFLLMSIHNSQLVTHGCHKALLEHLNRQVHFKQSPQTWAPSIPDVLSVFCNYGCEVSTILPEYVISPTEDKRYIGIIQDDVNGNFQQGGNYNLRNLHLVLDIIGQSLHASPQYSNRQLTELLVILCHVAMDKAHHSEVLPHEFQVCITALLRCYSCNYWDSHSTELCHILFRVTTHHHNRLYLAQLFPEDNRGSYIQKRLGYLFLQDIFDVGRDTDIKDFKIKCLHVFLPKLHTLVLTDVYKLASAISYLDLAVGNSAIKVSEKEDLQYLSDQIKKISGDIKDSVRMLDRSWVKDMMVRVCSKWTLYMLSVGSKQKSIFAYAKKKTPVVQIKTVEATQEDVSSQSEEESEDITANGHVSRMECQIIDENSNTSDTKTINNLHENDNEAIKNSSHENDIDDTINSCPENDSDTPDIFSSVRDVVKIKHEDEVTPIIDCESPMHVDLTLDDDLPDLF